MSSVIYFAGSALLVFAAWAVSPALGLLATGGWLIWVARKWEGV